MARPEGFTTAIENITVGVIASNRAAADTRRPLRIRCANAAPTSTTHASVCNAREAHIVRPSPGSSVPIAGATWPSSG
jgi:hypothetical protein